MIPSRKVAKLMPTCRPKQELVLEVFFIEGKHMAESIRNSTNKSKGLSIGVFLQEPGIRSNVLDRPPQKSPDFLRLEHRLVLDRLLHQIHQGVDLVPFPLMPPQKFVEVRPHPFLLLQ